MGAAKAISSLLLVLLCSSSAWADKPTPVGPPAPASLDPFRPSSLRMDIPAPSPQTSFTANPTPGVPPAASTDIPPDSRVGLHMMTDSESPALEYKLSDTGAVRLRTTRRGAKLIMRWEFK